MPWVIHVNSIYHCAVLTVSIVVLGSGPETRTRNYGLWAHYVTITPTRDLFELPPRVELGTTDYKSVILPAKLQKHLSYIVQAFYFQFRELVSNLTLLTTVRVPEDITFVLGRGVEPLFPGWKPGILTDRWTEQLFFYYQHVKELFYSVVIFNNNTKLIHFFDTDKYKQKKPILLRWVFVRYFLQYYPISTLEVSASVAGVPNMLMVIIECIIILFLIKYIKLLKSVN